MLESSVERAYDSLREMAVGFSVKPGERMNEVEVARTLGMSRAPVREAMNRLASEGLLHSVPGRGFFCRRLSISEIESLYEVRADLECAAIRRAATRTAPEIFESLCETSKQVVASAEQMSIEALIANDEQFHLGLAHLAGNIERVRILENANARIRFVRMINLETRERTLRSLLEHVSIVEALAQGDGEAASARMLAHLQESAQRAAISVRNGLSRIFANETA